MVLTIDRSFREWFIDSMEDKKILQVNLNNNSVPAKAASGESVDPVVKKDLKGWLALFRNFVLVGGDLV